MDTLDLEARLGEYLQQLALLNQEDIREPNQSLILDFFCIDEEFTDFLRQDIFCATDSRNRTWSLINLREAETNGDVALDDLAKLLEYKGPSTKNIWNKIVYHTSEHQKNLKTIELILGITTREESNAKESASTPAETYQSPNADSMPTKSQRISDIVDSAGETPIDIAGKSEKNRSSTNKDPNYVGLAIGSVIICSVLAAALGNSTTSISEQTSNSPKDDIEDLVKLESDIKDAVLICELRPLIERANSLSLSEKSLIDRKDKVVSDANKAISFLDQGSAKYGKYWEDTGCRWGYQWFDQNRNDSFRAFVAISKHCANPVIHYGMTKTSDGNDDRYIKRWKVPLANFTKGEVRLPYYNEVGYGVIEKVTCSNSLNIPD